jgi:multidrug efflux pump subunit AcrA (membrane-fusion protein)
MEMKWKIIIWPVVILLAGFGLMRFFLSFRDEPTRRAPQVRPRIVNIEVVQLQDVPSNIIAFGRLKTAQPVTVYSEVSGILQPGELAFQPAQSFHKGDLLLKIDDRQARLDLNSAKSDLLNALATVLPEIKVDFPEEYEIWQTYFNNIGFDNRLEPLPQAANQKIKLYLSRFNVYKLYFQVRNLEILLNKHYFYAPFAGSIVSADLRVGSTARPGSKLGEIINLDNLEVEVPIAAEDVQWINKDTPIIFTSSEMAGEWKGKIKRVGKSIDEQTQTVPVFMTVSNNGSDHLYDGIFLRAEIPGTVIPEAFRIPRRALYNEKFVYLIKEGKLDYREINIARMQTDAVIINGGIVNGDSLVTDVLQGVASGMPALARESLKGDS